MARDKSYSVAVVATMSAGKSSLLNALMGVDLLPTQNEACTATVFKVTDYDELNHFVGRYRSAQDGWSEWCLVDKASLRDWNRKMPLEIELHGNVPNIDNTPEGIRLCFIDTPGPNNAVCEEHNKITMQVIADNDFSTLVFLINASVSGVNDEAKLLFALKEQLAKRQEQAQVIFALNKIDLLDIEKGESLQQTVLNIRNYLEKEIGFDNPLVIPVCSRLSGYIRSVIASHKRLTIRQVAQLKGEKLSPAQLRKIPRGQKSRLYYQCRLHPRLQREIANLLEQFRELREEYQKALALGVPNICATSYGAFSTPSRQVLIGDKFYTYRELLELEQLTGIPWLEHFFAQKMDSLALKTPPTGLCCHAIP